MVLDRWCALPPAMDSFADPIEAELGAEVQECGAWHALPFEVVERPVDRGVPVEDRQSTEQEGVGALLAEGGRQAGRPAQRQLPVERRLRDRVERAPSSEDRRGRLRAPARQA